MAFESRKHNIRRWTDKPFIIYGNILNILLSMILEFCNKTPNNLKQKAHKRIMFMG